MYGRSADSGGEKEELTTYIKELTAELKKEYAVSDAGITIDCAFGEKGEASILSYTAMARVIFYLRHVPNGVQHMSTVMLGAGGDLIGPCI